MTLVTSCAGVGVWGRLCVERWKQPAVPAASPLVPEVVLLLWVLLIMVFILALAALVAAFAAFTHRGAQVPAAPWLGDALERAVAAVPTLPGEQLQQQR